MPLLRTKKTDKQKESRDLTPEEIAAGNKQNDMRKI